MQDYYDINSISFFQGTVNADMTSHYKKFLKFVPKKGHILDAGCGSGRDSLMFKSYGYNVTPFDGSLEMCKLASKYLRQEVLHLKFQDLEFNEVFDGIWASASLLHVPSNEIQIVLKKLKKALKKDGILYASFKYGNFEGIRNGRYFIDLTEKTANELFISANFKLIKTWITNDVRKEHENEKWINILANN